MKINGNAIKQGNVIEHKGALWVAVKTSHVKPGKGGAFAQVELKNLRDNTKLNERFRSSETVERVILEEKKATYLYEDGDKLVFMDAISFEQTYILKELIGEKSELLEDGMEVILNSFNDEVISINDLYGGTYRIFTQIFESFGITFHFSDMNEDNVVQLINEKTKMIWIETPTNPMLNIIDIENISNISKQHNLMLVVDNTFATPYLQRPLDIGADIVMHSLTKYMSGHSDIVMGAVACKDPLVSEKLYAIQNSSGAIPSPHDCFLVLRGIKTLHLRMQRHCENAKQIAEVLKKDKKIGDVYWPGFEDHQNHQIAKKQMNGFGGMVSFSLKNNSEIDAKKLASCMKYFTLAESLGGVESLCSHPASMTHAAIPKEIREKTGVSDSLIRLSVGVEDIDDLIEDIELALNLI